MARVDLYTRTGCHLCDDAKAALERVRAEESFELHVTDVDSDPRLAEQYGLEVPVVLLDGKKVAKYHLDEAALLRRLRS
jgi:glutaredoxin